MIALFWDIDGALLTAAPANVREILETFAEMDGVADYVLTGDTEAVARARLADCGLLDLFDGGAFSSRPGERDDIARAALPLAEGAERVFVVGDTPAGIACAAALGARSVAVAAGAHSAAELAAHGPWAVLEQLPEPIGLWILVSA